MEKIKLFIVDFDAGFAELACKFMSAFPDMEILGWEANGRDALYKIHALKPDVLLFDLILPGMDGISLLRNIRDMHHPPVSICCTRFFSEITQEAVRSLGASYLLFKPIELRALHPIIVSCMEIHRRMCQSAALMDSDLEPAQKSVLLRNHIVSLGISSNLIGCAYLAEALRLVENDVTLIRNLSKGLYLEIARTMNTTPVRVERCIRNAIGVAYQNGRLTQDSAACPSNKEFINYALRTFSAK